MIKSGEIMKMCIKKLYCGNCKKLVSGSEQKVSGATQVICCTCKQPLWLSNGGGWKNIRDKRFKKEVV